MLFCRINSKPPGSAKPLSATVRTPKKPQSRGMRLGSDCQKNRLILPGMHEGAAAPSYLRPGLRSACPGFRFANVVCEPPAAQSAASEIRSGGMYAARTRPKWPLPLSFFSRPGPRFTCPGFRPCGALKRCPRASSRVNAAFDRRCRRQQENDATRKNEVFIFSKGVDFVNTQRARA